jgi:hypothetical protein
MNICLQESGGSNAEQLVTRQGGNLSKGWSDFVKPLPEGKWERQTQK